MRAGRTFDTQCIMMGVREKQITVGVRIQNGVKFVQSQFISIVGQSFSSILMQSIWATMCLTMNANTFLN